MPSSVHQQKKFYLMYYIHISLYGLVIPLPLIPPIPPVFTSCSKARGGLLEGPYLPSAPFILIVVRGPKLAPLANWARLTDLCSFVAISSWPFWTLNSLFMPVRVWKNPCLSRLPLPHLALPLPLDFSVMDSVPLDISVMDFVTLGTFSRSYNAPSVPVPFPQIFAISYVRIPSWFAPFIRRTSRTLCFLLSLWRPHGSFTVTLFYFDYYSFLLLTSLQCIIRRLFCAPPRLVYTILCFQNKFTASFYHWVFNIFY